MAGQRADPADRPADEQARVIWITTSIFKCSFVLSRPGGGPPPLATLETIWLKCLVCVCVCVCDVCMCVCVLVSGTMLLFHVHSFCTNINDDCATLHDSPSRVGWSGPHSASVSSTDDLANCIENESVRYNLRALGPPTYILVKQGPHT